MYKNELIRAEAYAKRRNLTIEEQLGGGLDGVVLSTNAKTAIKALRYQTLYERERDVYLRLQQNEVEKIDIFHVPSLIDYHDELWIVEMQIVSPPFVVDFATAYLDSPPDYPEEVMEEWEREKQELFGS